MTDEEQKALFAEHNYYYRRAELSFRDYLRQTVDRHEYGYVTRLAELHPEMAQFREGCDFTEWLRSNIRNTSEFNRLVFHWNNFCDQRTNAWDQVTKLTNDIVEEANRRTRKRLIEEAIREKLR